MLLHEPRIMKNSLIGIGLLALVACKSSRSAEPPPKGESVAEALVTLGPAVAERVGAIERLSLRIAPPAGPIPDKLIFWQDKQSATPNSVLLYDDELGGEGTKHYARIKTNDAYTTPTAAIRECSLFAKQIGKSDPALAKAQVSYRIKACATLRYAAVIRVDREVQPVVGKTVDNETSFTPGQIDATLLLFELPSGKPISGFAVSVRSASSFSPDKYNQHTILEDDLRFSLYRAISEKLRGIPATSESHTFR